MSQIQLLAAGPARHAARTDSALPHILLVVDCFPKALGGGERIALRLAGLLPQAGFRASLLTLAVHPETTFQPEEAPCPIYLLPLRNTYGADALRGALALRRFLREHQIQLVQTFFESSDLWAGLVTRLFSPAKLVWSRRDMGILRQRKHSVAYRLLRRLPHGVFAVSERVAEHVATVDRVPRKRIRVIHNGLDLPTRTPINPADRGAMPVVTTIGNIRHVKGHDVLVEAAAQVLTQRPDVAFTIAGDILEQDYYERLKSRVEALGIADRFHFLGRISDLTAHLAGASVFVLPSRSEGFSNALIEAMAGGLPAVATDVGGNAEAIEHDVSGLLIPPDDAAALARAILELLGNTTKAGLLSEKAKLAVASRFSADAMLGKVAEAYSLLLGK